jgi:hypothetical protein
MHTHRVLLIAAMLAVAQPRLLCAQLPSSQDISVTPKQAMDEMKAALRELVWGEEEYWARHETYTTDLISVRGVGIRSPAKGVVLSIHHAGGRAWAASAQHRGLPNRSCVIYVASRESFDDFPAPATLHDNVRPQVNQIGMPLCDQP